MALPENLFSCLTNKCMDYNEHLDDTLLNRLERCLSCEDGTHGIFWESLKKSDLDMHFEDEVENFKFRGITELKLAIVWRLRNSPHHFELQEVGQFITNIISAGNPLLLPVLHTFFDNVSKDPVFLRSLGLNVPTLLPPLERTYIETNNINARKTVAKIMAILCHFTIQDGHPDSFNSVISQLFNDSRNVNIALDFYCQLISLSSGVARENAFKFLHESAKRAIQIAGECTKDDENLFDDVQYLCLMLCPFVPIDDYHPNIDASSSAIHLRRLLINRVFQKCPQHEHLVAKWYAAADNTLTERHSALLRTLISPLATCPVPLLKHEAFTELLPSSFLDQLWAVCKQIFTPTECHSSTVYRNCWLLYNQLCFGESEASRKAHLNEILHAFSTQPGPMAAFPFLADCAFTLYQSLTSLSDDERVKTFGTVYDLAHNECENVKTTGGELFYSFLLLRIFECSSQRLPSQEFAVKLVQLQKLVSLKIAEDPSLISNETVITIHRGFFVNKLLSTDLTHAFSPQICSDVIKLTADLHELRQVVNNDQVFSCPLKGILLACLLHCFANPAIIENLKETELYKVAVRTCIGLLSVDLEEDPCIRESIIKGWNKLLEVG